MSEDRGVVGRGYLWITGAKLWFLVTATVLNIGLPRLLGDPATFGAYKVVAGLLAVLSMVVLAGSLQTASKAASESPADVGRSRRRAERIAGGLALGIGLIVVAAAPQIADALWRDRALVEPLRAAMGVVVCYGLYATWIGVANGLKRYATQAKFDVAFATLKTGAIIGAVLLGAGVTGIFGVFSACAVLMTLAAWLVIARTAKGHATGDEVASTMLPRRMLKFMLGVMGFNLTLNLLLQGDVVLLKRLVHEASGAALNDAGALSLIAALAPDGGSLPADALVRQSTSALAGVYGATRNVTMIPYSGIISLTFVVFPLLSASTFQDDRARTQATVHGALRFAMLMITLLCGGLLLTDDVLLGVLFGSAYRSGVAFLLPMATGTVAFALYVVVTSFLTAAGYPGRVLFIGAICTALHLGAVALAAAVDAPPTARATATAWASMIGPLLGMLAASALLVRMLGVSLPWLGAVRALGTAALAVALVSAVLPASSLVSVVGRLAMFTVVLPVLWVLSREVGRADLRAVTRLLGRGEQTS